MFQPKTERIKILAEKFPQTIIKLEEIFDKPTNVYIDYANAAHWQGKLGWHIDIKRLKQLFVPLLAGFQLSWQKRKRKFLILER